MAWGVYENNKGLLKSFKTRPAASSFFRKKVAVWIRKTNKHVSYQPFWVEEIKKNPMTYNEAKKSMPRNVWIKGNVMITPGGQVKVAVPMPKKNPRNIAQGFYDATGFHPIRSSSDYDPDRAGDDYSQTTRKRKKPAKKKAAAKKKKSTKKKK